MISRQRARTDIDVKIKTINHRGGAVNLKKDASMRRCAAVYKNRQLIHELPLSLRLQL